MGEILMIDNSSLNFFSCYASFWSQILSEKQSVNEGEVFIVFSEGLVVRHPIALEIIFILTRCILLLFAPYVFNHMSRV